MLSDATDHQSINDYNGLVVYNTLNAIYTLALYIPIQYWNNHSNWTGRMGTNIQLSE